MRLKRLSLVVLVTLLMGMGVALALQAAPADLEPGGVVIPLGARQTDVRAAYRLPLANLYNGGRLHRLAQSDALTGTALLPGPALPGDLYVPPGEGAEAPYPYTAYELAGTLPVSRAYALFPGRVAVLRSTVTVPVEIDDGYVMAMWELAEIRQVLEGYLLNAVPYTVLSETDAAAQLADYDLLIVPAFRSDARDAVHDRLEEAGALDAIAAFVDAGGTLYAQGSGLWIAEQAGVLPEGTVDLDWPIRLLAEDAFANQGWLTVAQPDSPLAWSWLTDSLYILDDPVITAGDGIEVVAELSNAEGGAVPAIIRYAVPESAGQVIGVVGHPTDATRRAQLPLFMNALLLALSGQADFYGDAIQTWNPAYDLHTFPAYESVPVSATLVIENLWDATLGDATVTEIIAAGYTLTGTISPAPTDIYTTAAGETVLIWQLGDLAPHTVITLTYQAQSEPETLAAGIGTFATGELRYTDLDGRPGTARHRPFVLTALMAARLAGDRDIEGDRYFVIPDDGIYLDVALPLENKESTLAASLWMTDYVILIAPIVDIANQHVILNANDGETIWIKNEPYLWDARKDYPLWEGATSPMQTLTLDDWRALPEAERPRCVFTSAHGIHIDPPLRVTTAITDYGSFVTIPPTYTDAITVVNEQLLLPCLPLTWDLGDFPGYWYEEPAVRYGIHSRELFERDVYFHGTPRENAVVMPYDAGSVYVLAGDDPVLYRQYLDHETPYAPQASAASELTYQDVWSRTHALTFRAAFYDVWDWDSCATCGDLSEQHAGFAVTFGIWADLDGNGTHETLVREIPTRLDDAQLQLLGKTYSVNTGDDDFTIPAGENLIDLPVFHGLGVKIGPQGATWDESWRSAGPGTSELFTVTEGVAYDDLYFRQVIPPGSWAAFVVSATIENYPFNREGQFKLHDGGRLVYRQPIAGSNRYEVYDAHVHVAEGLRSDGVIEKTGGPIQVSVYSDTLMFIYKVWDECDARDFAANYDPFIKSWGYGDLVWTTYVGGREDKTLFSPVLGPGERSIVRVALDNNTGVTLTNLSVVLGAVPGIAITHLYTDPATAPEPIWPELSFLNRADVPDAWRSVWYFEIAVDDVATDLWGKVLEIPVIATADNFPAGQSYHEVPPARIALQRPEDAAPAYVSGPASALVLTDTLPANVVLNDAAWTTDATVVAALHAALDADAGVFTQDTASLIYAGLVPTQATPLSYTADNGLVTFALPAAVQQLPLESPLYVIAPATLIRAQHGPNVVNAGAGIAYLDSFGVPWTAQSEPVIVEAHGAAVWVDYFCDGGVPPSRLHAASGPIYAIDGECYIPDYGPSEVWMMVTAYNAGDAIARAVTVTLTLPEWVTVTWASPSWSALVGQQVTWALGDFAPGQWRQFDVIFFVEPVGDGITTSPIRNLLGIHHSDGVFFDDYSKQTVSGQVGEAFWFKVYRTARGVQVYLPVVLRGYDTRPDLLIESLTVDPHNPAHVEIFIVNVGRQTATDFWLDLYFDPAQPPVGNQPWPKLCEFYGAAWFVDALDAGERLTLTLDGPYYRAEHSQWPQGAYPPGAHAVWAYVDSLGPNEAGWVSEADETNNRYGPVAFTAPEGAGFGAMPQPAHSFLPRMKER